MDMNTAHAMPFAQGSASASATSSSSCVAPAPARAPGQRNRLRPKAACYLDEFVSKHGLNPTREQRDILVAGVKSFPGHDYYNRHLLERWLYTRRAGIVGGAGSASSKGTAPPGLATTLTSKQISDLRDLVALTPKISAELLAVWERLLHVQKSVIEAWIRDNPVLPPTPITPTHPTWAPEESVACGRPVEEWRAGVAHGTHQQRLPTPAETASPDPESPLLLHTNIQSSYQQLPRCNETSNPSVATSRSECIRAAILQGIRDGAKVSVHHPPKTMAELDAFWATFEPKLSRVTQTLESIPRP